MTCLAAAAASVACGSGTGGGSFGQTGGFSARLFPIGIDEPNNFGQLALDSNGDLLAADGSSAVVRISQDDGGQANLTVDEIPGVVISVIEDATGTVVAGNTGGLVFEIRGAVTALVAALGASANGFAIAPPSFGDFEGQLLAATAAGELIAIDTSVEPSTQTIIDDTGTLYSDLEFDSEGTLYVVDNGSGEIVTIGADGTVTPFANAGITGPDGIAVDEENSRLLVADSAIDELLGVAIPGAAVTSLGAFDFDPGPEPSGLAVQESVAFISSGGLSGERIVRAVDLPRVDPGIFPVGPIPDSSFGFGNVLFDREGNLITLVHEDPGISIRRIDREDGSISTLFRDPDSPDALAIALEPVTGTYYLGDVEGSIRIVSGGAATPFIETIDPNFPDNFPLCIAIAPENFGLNAILRGGHLIVTTDNGRILDIDPERPATTRSSSRPSRDGRAAASSARTRCCISRTRIWTPAKAVSRR